MMTFVFSFKYLNTMVLLCTIYIKIKLSARDDGSSTIA